MIRRPAWANSSVEMQEYYDHYWGFPVHNDQKLFEMLSLELFQAGLTWQTIWKRRAAFEQAFANFVIEEVATFDKKKIEQLCADPTIIRNRRKIEAVVNNANVILQLRKKNITFNDYIWQFVGGKAQRLVLTEGENLPAQTRKSQEISRQMRKAGFKFIGPTIIYSFMTAVGMVNARLE
ncbi:DNA-3-methyladenine glycosylase I [Limosilactobacillus sp. STM2_1]|uniref:DNA-3-methyladenine glycosylase I n=1 Tax=Limosilactobacillus rudii TaxID=2759755 RepID=A0A7W3YLK4_9LACO|nr:DNA-3-methyladenine glycosylase I [Limosilactobacillus rudii]MBB1080048.1 DNA-3-methyladenine glycosylase I [Limosilactobacillus rudii]MBB1096464.1 DNA-3-methyladenine glycosylase I [Limosilactobacillus rudii]MCD7133535.1 DNA-3-methyladenine glycosylase I [Limosilactobacillus rudii]